MPGRGTSDGAEAPVRPPLLVAGPAADREADERMLRVLETMPTAFACFDADWRFTYVNAEACRILRRDREDLLGGNHWDLFPATLGEQTEISYRHAVATGEPVAFEAFYPAPLNRWYEVRAWPSEGGLAVYFLDISERRAALDHAELVAQRLELVARVTAELSGTLDGDEAVGRLAPLVVPAIADWCIVTVMDSTPQGTLRDVGTWHVDPAARPQVAEYAAVRQAALLDSSPLRVAARTGRAQVVPTDALAVITRQLSTEEARNAFAALVAESLAVLPLRGRSGIVGLLTLANGPERGPFSETDLVLAGEIAALAGLALDNANTFAQQRDIAEELQRSLLTAPPEPDHLQVVVRYEAAAQAAQVGGDWYDAFLQPDGATVLVIGDVIGHDTAAAAAMGHLRAVLRGLAARAADSPAAILTEVDQVLETLQVSTSATVVVARLEQTLEERERGVTRLRWSNAGHPPPMVINPDGSVMVLAGLDADLLLGIDPTSTRVESEVVLDRGATVLLYTDGLVERRGQSLDEGLALLRSTLLELGTRDLDELCDQLIARLMPGERDDDVALVAVRLHRQDQPRPPEAGPQRVPDNVPPEPGSNG